MEIQGRVTVYSIVGCPHCLRAKNRLAEVGLPFTDISLDSFPQERETLKTLTGGKTTVPQIFFNEKHVGGNVEFQNLVKNKYELNKLIELVKSTPPAESAPKVPDPKTAMDYGKSDGEFVCEPDEYALLVRDLRNSGIIKDQKAGLLKTHKSSFKGQDLIDWLIDQKNLDRKKALDMGQELVGRNFGRSLDRSSSNPCDAEQFCPDGFYRLLEDDESKALNAGAVSECAPVPASELGENLRRLILKIYNKALSKDGKGVDYKSIAGDPDFEKYMDLTRELQRVDVGSCTREEKLAFFINVYNALVIHATIKIGQPTNLWQRYKFFNTVCYIIGGHIYSLQDMENGVLRGNRKGVGMFFKPFGKNDPRSKVALETCEPLIHFALNCGAKSCPPIKTFSSKGVKAELKVAAEAFFETDDAVSVDSDKKEVKVSQIFKWYQIDFGGNNTDVLSFILERMADGDKKDRLKKLVKSGNYKFGYLHYDWNSNSKDE